MINKQNIRDYIRFLYKMKNNTEPPAELLSKWASLNEEELQTNLQELYQYWNYSADKIQASEKQFMESRLKVNPPPVQTSLPPTTQIPPPVYKAPANNPGQHTSRTKNTVLYSLVALLVAGGIYVLYQYLEYQKLHTIYTLTQNVSIRDEAGNTIGNFASLPGKTVTHTELFALNTDIYPLSIDSTSKKYDFRKVVFEKPGFMAFLKKDYECGYVNANYVIENKEEAEEYARIFSKFQEVNNNRLKLSQRKIIFNVLKRSADNRKSYLLPGCNNSSKYFSGFLSNEIVENTRYQMIVKLEDGYYYSMIGDLNSNEYQQPTRIQLDGADCNENFLFKYTAKDGYKIYNCAGALLKITCTYDENKMISSFATVYEEPPIEESEPVLEEVPGDSVR